ncbi:MAG: DUF6494 family protein [Pseudolabrys sp.]
MDDAELKAAVAKFVRHVGFTAQREIEKALKRALAEGRLRDNGPLATAVTLSSDKVGLNVTIHSKIEL